MMLAQSLVFLGKGVDRETDKEGEPSKRYSPSAKAATTIYDIIH